MKNVLATVALAATFAAPAFADQLPLNSAVSGGQGVVSADGQSLALGGALSAGTITAIVVVGAVALITIMDDDGNVTTTTVSLS